MSNPEDKFKKSKRRHKKYVKIEKQVKIRKVKKWVGVTDTLKSPNQFAKKHAMDCGRPMCHLCGNPRRVSKEKTMQEKREEQVEE